MEQGLLGQTFKSSPVIQEFSPNFRSELEFNFKEQRTFLQGGIGSHFIFQNITPSV